MSNREKMLRTTMLAILAALLGFALGLGGCDGVGSDEGDAGHVKLDDAGVVTCEIPAGADVLVGHEHRSQILAYDVSALESGKSTFVPYVVVSNTASVCASSSGKISQGAACKENLACTDAAGDFLCSSMTTGWATFCFTLQAKGGGACQPSADGNVECEATGMNILETNASLATTGGNAMGTRAICSPDGTFAGWQC